MSQSGVDKAGLRGEEDARGVLANVIFYLFQAWQADCPVVIVSSLVLSKAVRKIVHNHNICKPYSECAAKGLSGCGPHDRVNSPTLSFCSRELV